MRSDRELVRNRCSRRRSCLGERRFASCVWRAAPAGALLCAGRRGGQRVSADDCAKDQVHGPAALIFHAPDPRMLGAGFFWKSALLTMNRPPARAPARRNSWYLVFALAQGILFSRNFLRLAMSLAPRSPPAALASAAVFAKEGGGQIFQRPVQGAALLHGTRVRVAAAAAVLVWGLACFWAVLAVAP